MKFDSVYYEPDSLKYPLGIRLREMFQDLPWIPIENHNSGLPGPLHLLRMYGHVPVLLPGLQLQ